MNPQDQIAHHLLSTKSLPVSQNWLSTFLNTTTNARNIPIQSLTQTALFRLLNSDFRDSLSATSTRLFPADIFNPAIKERKLQGPTPVQILDIDDIGTSLWSQVEEMERVERGETVRGREIIRTVNVDEREGPEIETTGNGNGNSGRNLDPGNNSSNNRTPGASGSNSNGPHRLILQDAAGTKAVAIEMKSISGVGIGSVPIGAKMVLRNVTVARGMLLLVPESVVLLGGKIEVLDREWRSGRKARLLGRIADAEREDSQ